MSISSHLFSSRFQKLDPIVLAVDQARRALGKSRVLAVPTAAAMRPRRPSIFDRTLGILLIFFRNVFLADHPKKLKRHGTVRREGTWHGRGSESAFFWSLINVWSLTLLTGGHEGHKGYFESGDVSGLFCYCFEFLKKKYDEQKKCPKFGTPFCLFLWCVKKAVIISLFKKILSHAGSNSSQ